MPRLKELQKLLAAERASDNPSKLYIDDLKLSISRLKKQAGQPAFQMVET